MLVPPNVTARGIDRDGNSCEIAVPGALPGDVGRWLVAEGWRWAMVLAGGVIAGYVLLDVVTLKRTWKEEEKT